MTVIIAKSDSQIHKDVLNELKWDARVDETDVGVQVHEGIVTLTGNVDAFVKKIAAREAAHRVYGVLDVVDQLQVKPPSRWQRSDEDLARSVREALRMDVLVPEDRITTTVASGIITLEGRVDYWTQRSDAEHSVRRLPGVRGVINQITVVPKRLDPGQIKQQIEQALERQAEREAKRLGISVADGVVTLTGVVRSWGERNAIERVVGYSPGVRQVNDRTTVDPYL